MTFDDAIARFRDFLQAEKGASEHTLAAYDLALAQGADALECDVRLTRDGHLVCVHDRTINRTSTGKGVLSTLELADLTGADLIFVIGANPTVNHPVAATWMKNAAKAGTRIVLADPRVTDIGRHAWRVLQFKPDTDVALLNALMHVIVHERLVDEAFIASRTIGYAELDWMPLHYLNRSHERRVLMGLFRGASVGLQLRADARGPVAPPPRARRRPSAARRAPPPRCACGPVMGAAWPTFTISSADANTASAEGRIVAPAATNSASE